MFRALTWVVGVMLLLWPYIPQDNKQPAEGSRAERRGATRRQPDAGKQRAPTWFDPGVPTDPWKIHSDPTGFLHAFDDAVASGLDASKAADLLDWALAAVKSEAGTAKDWERLRAAYRTLVTTIEESSPESPPVNSRQGAPEPRGRRGSAR